MRKKTTQWPTSWPCTLHGGCSLEKGKESDRLSVINTSLHMVFSDLQMPIRVQGRMPSCHLQNGDCCAQYTLLVRRIGMQGLHGSLAIFPSSADGLGDLVACKEAYQAYQTGQGKERGGQQAGHAAQANSEGEVILLGHAHENATPKRKQQTSPAAKIPSSSVCAPALSSRTLCGRVAK